MLGHAEHVRFAVLESALMRSPVPHVACAAHDVLRCDVAVRYVFAGHDAHLRLAVLVSALMRSPRPQVGCAVQLVRRCDVAVW